MNVPRNAIITFILSALIPLVAIAQSKPVVPTPKTEETLSPPELELANTFKTLAPIKFSVPKKTLTPEIERELKAFVLGQAFCSRETICGSLDFLWKVNPKDVFYVDHTNTWTQILLGKPDLDTWHLFLTQYQISKPADMVLKDRITIILLESKKSGFGIDVDRLKDSFADTIIFVIGQGFYSQESVREGRIKSFPGEDFLPVWEDVFATSTDIHKLPVCTKLRNEERTSCEKRQRAIIELQYRMVIMAGASQNHTFLLSGNEKMKWRGPQAEHVNHCVYDTLPASANDQEVRSCADLLWDYHLLSTNALFAVGQKFLSPERNTPLIPEDIQGFVDGIKSNAEVAKNYVRWMLPTWYSDTPNVALYKPIWDQKK